MIFNLHGSVLQLFFQKNSFKSHFWWTFCSGKNLSPPWGRSVTQAGLWFFCFRYFGRGSLSCPLSKLFSSSKSHFLINIFFRWKLAPAVRPLCNCRVLIFLTFGILVPWISHITSLKKLFKFSYFTDIFFRQKLAPAVRPLCNWAFFCFWYSGTEVFHIPS